MKVVVSTVHSMFPAFEFRISRHGFYKGLQITCIVWRKGFSVTFTTKFIYGAYMRDVFDRAKRIQKELR